MNLRTVLGMRETRKARSRIQRMEQATLEEQIRIVQIAAPTLAEEHRATHLLTRFEELGLHECRRDAAGNALARLPSAAHPDAAPVVVAAHLDTVFGADVDLTPRFSGDRVYAPGITDNARGVAGLIAIADALLHAGVIPHRPIWFVGTTGEEGSGDLRGTKQLLGADASLPRPAAFIALDGSGIRRIVHRAVGARRLRAEISGPGGHSWSDWGTANPLHALGQAIHLLVSIPRPGSAPATLTVGRATGGTSVNVIPHKAWLELDLRSERQEAIGELERASRRVLEEAVERENERRRSGTPPLALRIHLIGDRPSGMIEETAPLVAAAIAATRLVGATPELVASSTDANVPLALGIPAVTLGVGGESGGIHTLDEWFCPRGGALGLERGLLTVLAAAGVG